MKRICLVAVAAVLVAAGNAAAVTINVDFAPDINDPAATTNIYTVDYVGTAAAPDLGTVWNHIDTNNGSPAGFIGSPGYYDGMDGPATASSIVDSFGNSLPGVSVAINGGLGAFGSGDDSPTDGDTGAGLNYVSVEAQGLMRDYLIANGGNPGSVTISGLTPGTLFNLYAYGEGDNGGNERQTKFTANGVVGSTAGFAGLPHDTLVEGADYVILPGVIVDGSGNIEIAFELNGGGEAPFNGFQLTTVPEPVSLALAALAGLGLIAVRRKV
ncbi:MAG: hypothetical protein KDA44_15220 [Planctomycetales bacterium]|nr:hypothetical protein [Planctomycetales bacterium]